MADEIDIANDTAAADLELCLAAARAQQKTQEPTGECFYCEAPVEEDRRFCDAECARGWEQEQNLLKMRGEA